MELILTHYVDAAPGPVADHLDEAVTTALTALSDTTGRTEATETGLRLVAGSELLTGSEIRVTGTDRLTSVQVAVPWTETDGPKLRAANRLAGAIVDVLNDTPLAA